MITFENIRVKKSAQKSIVTLKRVLSYCRKFNPKRLVKFSCKFIKTSVVQYKESRKRSIIEENDHRKLAEYISLVLQRRPFLLSKSQDEENYEWLQIAYELQSRNRLLPELVRYRIGPMFFVSFGPVTNQLKRQFYLLFLSNDKRVTLKSCKISKSNDKDTIKFRGKPLNRNFEFFSVSEVKYLLRREQDFGIVEEKSLEATSDWYHKWGWVYETEPTSYRTLEIEASNYVLELAVLDYLWQILKGSEFQEWDVTLQAIEKRRLKVENEYLPETKAKRDEVLEKMNSYKKNSSHYYHLMNY